MISIHPCPKGKKKQKSFFVFFFYNTSSKMSLGGMCLSLGGWHRSTSPGRTSLPLLPWMAPLHFEAQTGLVFDSSLPHSTPINDKAKLTFLLSCPPLCTCHVSHVVASLPNPSPFHRRGEWEPLCGQVSTQPALELSSPHLQLLLSSLPSPGFLIWIPAHKQDPKAGPWYFSPPSGTFSTCYLLPSLPCGHWQ